MIGNSARPAATETHTCADLTGARGVSLRARKLFSRDTDKAKRAVACISQMSAANTHLSNCSDSTYITRKYQEKSQYQVLTMGEEGHSIVSVGRPSDAPLQVPFLRGCHYGGPVPSKERRVENSKGKKGTPRRRFVFSGPADDRAGAHVSNKQSLQPSINGGQTVIRAIETEHAGVKYRSRTEARWKVLFERLEIDVEYEREGFHLTSGCYLPDFWLPVVKMWAEVKGQEFTAAEIQRCRELADMTECPVLMLDGPPAFKFYDAIHPADPDLPDAHFVTGYSLDIWDDRKARYNQGKLYGCGDGLAATFKADWCFTEDYRQAVLAARTARFGREGRW